MIKPVTALLPMVALVGMIGSATVKAEDSTSGYVVDSNGAIVKDRFGNCVRNINWQKDIESCGGEAKPVVKVAPKPVPVTKPEPVVKTVVIDDKPAAFVGFFEFDKTDLKDEAKNKLDEYADYMEKHPGKRLMIRGYTDSMGSDDYNLELSAQRASAVQSYLVSKGVSAQRIMASGRGEADPVADNATEAGRAQNRRVELELRD